MSDKFTHTDLRVGPEGKLLHKQLVIQRVAKADMPCFILNGPSFDEASAQAHIDLCADDWAAMGSPDQITVTIEPGDRLNS